MWRKINYIIMKNAIENWIILKIYDLKKKIIDLI